MTPMMIFDDFLGMKPSVRPWPQTNQTQTKAFSPKVDIKDKSDHFEFIFDLPGISKEELDVEIYNRDLSIRGKRLGHADQDQDAGLLTRERSLGSFKRTFRLPVELDPQNPEASLENGVLRLKINKSRAAKPHKIDL